MFYMLNDLFIDLTYLLKLIDLLIQVLMRAIISCRRTYIIRIATDPMRIAIKSFPELDANLSTLQKG